MRLQSSLGAMGDQAIDTIEHASAHIDIAKGILKITEKGLVGDEKVEKSVKSSRHGVQTAQKHELMAEFLFPASGQEDDIGW
ncbi:hypothetical protein C368_06736 [Cryptococcus neoformans 125.91]|nr:hypothetical protein C368_06736 [Cryptococcus neoformans var. grubii 125.91]